MTSDDSAASELNETTVPSANAASESSATATTKPELQQSLAEDDEEWEGFYENADEYDEF